MESNLYDLRMRDKLSLERLSKKAQISVSHLYRIENNETIPTVQKCKILADVFHVTLEELFHFEQEEKEEMIVQMIQKKKAKEMLTTRELFLLYPNMDDQFKILLTKFILRYYNLNPSSKHM